TQGRAGSERRRAASTRGAHASCRSEISARRLSFIVDADASLLPLGRRHAGGSRRGARPGGFARAPTSGWHDVPAGAEVVFWSLYRALGGIRGLVVAQAVAAAIGFGALARGLAREGFSGAALPVSVVVLAGSIPAVAITGVSLFSLALFPVLLGLLE